jgi:ABC-type lipoprotein export system ATPase subunit
MSIIILYLIIYLNINNRDDIQTKLSIKESDKKNIKIILDQFYQDIFNISVNLDSDSIEKFNSDYIIKNKSIYHENKFYNDYDNIYKIIIILLFSLPYVVYQNNSIPLLEYIVILKYIIYIIDDFILSKQRTNSFINYMYDLLEIYSLKQKKQYTQFPIDNKDNLIINKLNINTNYINLQLSKPIILKPKKLYLIVGPSGSGKTTFVKTIRCINPIDPNDTEIVVNGTIYDLNSITSNIYYVDQSTKLYRTGTIYEIITGFNDSYTNPDYDILIDELLSISKLDHVKSKTNILNLHNMSGGEINRISICKTLFLSKMKKKRLIIMDEIDAALDINTTINILSYIKNSFNESTILYISHKEHIHHMGFPIININNGKILLK